MVLCRSVRTSDTQQMQGVRVWRTSQRMEAHGCGCGLIEIGGFLIYGTQTAGNQGGGFSTVLTLLQYSDVGRACLGPVMA